MRRREQGVMGAILDVLARGRVKHGLEGLYEFVTRV